MFRCSGGWLLSGVALVRKGHLNIFSGCLLNIVREVTDLGTLLFIGRGDL